MIFLAKKICGSYVRIKGFHQLQVMLYFLIDRAVLREAPRADNSSDIATSACVFISFWQGGRGEGREGDGDWQTLLHTALDVAFDFCLLSCHTGLQSQ